MRISIIAWLLSSVILTCGALLAALATDNNEHRWDRRSATFVTGPCDLNQEAIGSPSQPTDELI